MTKNTDYLIFEINGKKYAVSLDQVDIVVRAATLISIPQSPKNILGGLNLHGKVIPVMDIRKIFGHAPKAMDIDDRIIVFHPGSDIRFAAIVDSIGTIVAWNPGEIDMQCRLFSEQDHFFCGIGKLDGENIIICRMDKIPGIDSLVAW